MWKQLHFDFKWPDLTEREAEKILSDTRIKSGEFIIVDLVDGRLYGKGDLFYCKRAILTAQQFYQVHLGYLENSYLTRYYYRKHFQLLFKT
jgi:hypothetical protein